MNRKVSNFVTEFCNYADGYEGSYLFRFWAAVSVVSATLERRVWTPIGDHQLFANTYIFLVGDSGTRKSSTAGIAIRFIKDLNLINLVQDRLTPASLIKTLKESETIFQYGGKPYIQSACFAYSSELRTLLEDIGGGSLISLLTDFYDSRYHGEKFENRTVKHGKSEIYGPGLSILGCSTPDWFMQVLPYHAIGGGFTSRVIFVVQTTGIEQPIPEPPLADKKLRKALVETLKEIHTLTGPMTMTERARGEYNDWYVDHIKTASRELTDERFKGYAMRKGDFVRKVAMILSVSQRSDMTINEYDIVTAIGALDAIESNMMRAFGPVSESPNAKLLSKILIKLPEAPEEIGHSELLRLVWYHVGDIKQFNLSMETLLNTGGVEKRITEDSKKIFYSRLPGFDLHVAARNLDRFEKMLLNKRLEFEQRKIIKKIVDSKSPTNGNGQLTEKEESTDDNKAPKTTKVNGIGLPEKHATTTTD